MDSYKKIKCQKISRMILSMYVINAIDFCKVIDGEKAEIAEIAVAVEIMASRIFHYYYFR